MKNRLLALLLMTALLAAFAGIALAENPAYLSLTVTGRTALGDGSWDAERLVVDFRAEQNGVPIGVLTADGEASLACSGGTLVLYPVTGENTAGWHFEAGYMVAITAGALNRASIDVRAEAGLFAVTADPGVRFTLTPMEETDDPRFPMTLTADENGLITPERALPVGDYVLQDEEGRFRPMPLTLTAYTGAEEDIARADASAASMTLAPVIVNLSLEGGAGRVAEATLTQDTRSINVFLEEATPVPVSLTPGDWILAVNVPDGCYADWEGERLTGSFTRTVTVTEAGDLTLKLCLLGGISGSVPAADGISAQLWSEEASAGAEAADGVLRAANLLPGTYTVTLTLPAGEYVGEGWDIASSGNAVIAETTVAVAEGETAALPDLAAFVPTPTPVPTPEPTPVPTPTPKPTP
ncbi:MAG: hypothetical protein IJL69_00365, partial [Oscillospiraceae bacterium]|nr:hypothetical protein [Oscillospiraceae bacterium]